MHLKRLFLLVLLTFVGVQSSCAKSNAISTKNLEDCDKDKNNSSPIKAESSTFNIIQQRWLNQEVCTAPCWEGITPGVTTKEEAMQLLKQTEYVSDIEDFVYGSISSQVTWNWEEVTAMDRGRLFYSLSGQKIVYAILPGIEQGLTLGDIVCHFGQPTHAWVIEVKPFEKQEPAINEKQYSLGIVWVDKGIGIDGVNPANLGMIDQNLLIGSITLFSPDIEGYLDVQGNSAKNMMKWHGYGTWESYLVSKGE